MLGSVRSVGADPRFYDVDETLHTVIDSLNDQGSVTAKAIVAVNYFGFPQPIEPLWQWCRAHRAVLIEDNAHGFLSADGSTPLGRRGDFGIFSLRKTLALPNGAALVDNRPGECAVGDAPFRASSTRTMAAWALKRAMKGLLALVGTSAVRPLIASVRLARRCATGTAVPSAPSDAEVAIPQEELAPITKALLRHTAVGAESERRRSLFRQCQALLHGVPDVRPVFTQLPDGVVPQGFPFFYLGPDPRGFVDQWWRSGVPVVGWPDLPSELGMEAPVHYRQVMLIPFLW